MGADVSILCGLPSNKREKYSFWDSSLGCYESFLRSKIITIGLCSLTHSQRPMNDDEVVAKSFSELRKLMTTDRLSEADTKRGLKIINTLEKLFLR